MGSPVIAIYSLSPVFEEPEDPSNRSFFSEIISSVSDVKFSHSGRYMLTRDYLTVKVWDLNMEARPIETYQVGTATQKPRGTHLWGVRPPQVTLPMLKSPQRFPALGGIHLPHSVGEENEVQETRLPPHADPRTGEPLSPDSRKPQTPHARPAVGAQILTVQEGRERDQG